VDEALTSLLPSEETEPVVLHKAMRYSVFAGGKRIRPILAIAAAELTGNMNCDLLMPLAASIEAIHTYSLIHDDLPAMDDDDLRRGRPTAHKEFGEGIAILSGDALLTWAFEVLTGPSVTRMCVPQRLVRVIRTLSRAAGSRKLIAGQILDITLEGKTVDEQTAQRIVDWKTGALISASVVSGAQIVGASQEIIEALSVYGTNMGAVFQIRDDILDLEGSPEQLGKAVNKDRGRGKATLPSVIGKEQCLEKVKSYSNEAVSALEPWGEKAAPLIALAGYISERIN
jgi:geranylgeranyl diphosphate synthase type II